MSDRRVSNWQTFKATLFGERTGKLTQSSQWSQSHLDTLLSNTHLSPQSNITIQNTTTRCGKLRKRLAVKFNLRRSRTRAASMLALLRPGPLIHAKSCCDRVLRVPARSSARVRSYRGIVYVDLAIARVPLNGDELGSSPVAQFVRRECRRIEPLPSQTERGRERRGKSNGPDN